MEVKVKNNIYLIPITDFLISVGGIPLCDYLSTYYPTFKRLEDERISIIFSASMYDDEPEEEKNEHERRYQKHLEFTKRCAEDARIPLYLIAVGNKNNVREIVTNIKITSDQPASLDFRILDDILKKRFEIPENYEEYSRNFLSNIAYESRNEKRTYTVEEFLSITDFREKIRVAFGGFKSSINFDIEPNAITICEDGKVIDLSLLFIAKYNLSVDDFISLVKLRLLNRDSMVRGMQSDFFKELDNIINLSEMLKKSVKERLLNLLKKNQSS